MFNGKDTNTADQFTLTSPDPEKSPCINLSPTTPEVADKETSKEKQLRLFSPQLVLFE
jgi:hypothetical protein